MAAWLCRALVQRNGRLLPSYPNSVGRLCSRGVGSSSPAPGALSAFQDKPRTVEDLPNISFLELIYRMVFQGFYNRLHELQIDNKQRYGHIYREGQKSVSVNTPQLLEEVLRNDEKFPTRGDLSAWKEYRDMRGYGYGPFTEEGERWYNLRVMLNKRMLHPKDSAQYGDDINDVVTDFIKRLSYLRQCSPEEDLVPDMANELYRFSLEGIASILFETRLGCLEKEIPAGTQDFIHSIGQMFSYNLAAFLMPKWSRSLLPYWRRYIEGWEGIFCFGKKLIDKKMEVIQQRVENNQEVEGEYLTYLLSNTQMSTKDVYGSITELLLAGMDTTSNTLTWTFYLLSRNPHTQDRLYEEVSTMVPAKRIPSAAEDVPCSSCECKDHCRKECCYWWIYISKENRFTLHHYAISHDEETFPEPFTFKPERWLRDGRVRPNPFASIPFGFGVRGCVGRRIAELEMYMALFRVIRHFEIKPDPTMGELKCINRTVLVPDKPLSLYLVDR
ncbi:hypothetical protein F7725_001666 [Dissostichus mawsoni]|uniref:Sterol 26-hydroxylase, mitochondrial n=1 Tax=Dissostichus mawsoni TaxID=36200 RepID=A0A7J5Y2B6_DISMA|nr:hypothetical protein F7725_001666 [Dissostichus mawsoni]